MGPAFTAFIGLYGHSLLLYAIVFLVTLGESLVFVGLLIPGTALLALAGSLSVDGSIRIVPVLIAAALGAIVGNSLSHEMGRFGKGLFHRLAEQSGRSSLLMNGEKFFGRHGGKSVFLSNFFPPARNVIPFLSGIMHVKRPRFYLASVLGALCWSVFYISIGALLGHAWNLGSLFFSLSITCVLLLLFFLRRLLRTS